VIAGTSGPTPPGPTRYERSNGGDVPPRKQFPVSLEVSLTEAQAAALRRHAAFLDVPVAELLRSLVATATESWTKEQVNSNA
jgi:hypothetical protein